jgi:hypothetical protein
MWSKPWLRNPIIDVERISIPKVRQSNNCGQEASPELLRLVPELRTSVGRIAELEVSIE